MVGIRIKVIPILVNTRLCLYGTPGICPVTGVGRRAKRQLGHNHYKIKSLFSYLFVRDPIMRNAHTPQTYGIYTRYTGVENMRQFKIVFYKPVTIAKRTEKLTGFFMALRHISVSQHTHTHKKKSYFISPLFRGRRPAATWT